MNKFSPIFILITAFFLSGFVRTPVAANTDVCDLQVSIIAAPFAVVDSNKPGEQGPRAATFSAVITNNGTTPITNLRVSIGDGTTPGTFSSVEGGSIGLAPSESATRVFNSLGTGESRAVYWVVTYPFTYDVTYPYQIWASNDTGCQSSDQSEITTQSEISASANKILPTGSLMLITPQSVTPGDQITLQITGFTLGTIGQGPRPLSPYDAWFQPIGNLDFDPTCLRLVRSEVKLNSISATPFVNQLYFDGIRSYRVDPSDYVKYTFISLRECSTVIQPYQEAASGTQEKYNGDFELSTSRSNIVSANTSNLIVVISPDNDTAVSDDTIVYSIETQTTSGSIGSPESGNPIVVEADIPSGTTYVSGSATNDDSATLAYSQDGGATWSGSEPTSLESITDLQWTLSEPVTTTSTDLTFSVLVDSDYTGDPIETTANAGLIDSVPLDEDTAFVNGAAPTPTPSPTPTQPPTPEPPVQSGEEGGLESGPIDLPPSSFLGEIGGNAENRAKLETFVPHKAQIRAPASLGLLDLLPTTGPDGTTPTNVVPVDVLAITTAPDAKAVDFVDANGDVRAVALGIESLNGPYEHDYGVCNRFKEYEFEQIAPVEINGHWFWRGVSIVDGGFQEDALIFHIFVDEATKTFHIDSRWVQDSYPTTLPYSFDYVFNMQVWSSELTTSTALLEDILDTLTTMDGGTWTLTYHNDLLPTAPTMMIERVVYEADIVRLTIQNTTNSPQSVRLYGTWRSHLARNENVPFEYNLTLPSGEFNLSLPFEGLLDLTLYLESNGFTDKIYTGGGLWFPVQNTISAVAGLTLDACQTLDAINSLDLLLAGCATVSGANVTQADQLGLGRTLNPNGRAVDVSPYQALRFWARGDGSPVRVLLETANITDGDYYQTIITPGADWQQYILPINVFAQQGFGTPAPFSTTEVKAVIWLNADSTSGDFALSIDRVSFTNNSLLAITTTPTNTNVTTAQTVVAGVDSGAGIQSVAIFYSLDGGNSFDSTPMSSQRLPNLTQYTGQIPGQALGTDIVYYLEATNIDGYRSRTPIDAPTTVYRYRVDDRPTLLVDDFAGQRLQNRLAQNSGIFNAPSVGGTLRAHQVEQQLVLDYDVQADGQFAGYFTQLGTLDATSYTTLDILLRGETGNEHMLIGLADGTGFEPRLSVGDLLPGGITTKWQWVQIPLTAFSAQLDLADLQSLSFAFFDGYNAESGRMYIDEIRLTNLSAPLWVDTFDDGNLTINAQGNAYFTNTTGQFAVNASEGDATNTNGYALQLDAELQTGQFALWQSSFHSAARAASDTLQFWVKGNADDTLVVNVYLQDGDGERAYVALDTYTTLSDEWAQVSIPLSAFGNQGVNLSKLVAFQLAFEFGNGRASVWLDQVQIGAMGTVQAGIRHLYATDTTEIPLALHLSSGERWQMTSDSAWLTIPNTGYGPTTAPIRATAWDLPTGEYTGTLTVSTDNGGLEEVVVHMIVTESGNTAPFQLFLPLIRK